MGQSKLARQTILEALGRSQKGKKELKTVVKAKDPGLKKYVKKTLKKLVQTREIVKDGNLYRIAKVGTVTEATTPSAEKNDLELPIAVRLRKEQEAAAKKSVKFAENEIDLDDEIKRLEMELNQASDESSDEESSKDGEDENPAVLSLSAYADDRIEHLPETCLPEPGKYHSRAKPGSFSKKTGTTKKSGEQSKKDGLKEAVQEVLNGYRARSSERLPFYCRFCSKQYSNETEFFDHKNSDFHKTAVAMERKATYCRLCRKQLTSPEQMKEHLLSRPHKERLQTVRIRQRSDANGSQSERGRSARQWS